MRTERETTTVEHSAGVVISNARFRCTRCRQWKPAGMFGLRKMADGKVRNQPQCCGCRSLLKAAGG